MLFKWIIKTEIILSLISLNFIDKNCQQSDNTENWNENKKMAKLYFAISFLIFEKAFSENKISLKCTPEFCDEYVQRFPCPPLDPACSNPNISLVIPSPTVCNCCEHCFVFKDLGEDCVSSCPGQPLPNVICKPGATCHKGKCKQMTTPDQDFYRGYECEGEKCYCTVVENNTIKKIFGAFEKTESITYEKQCECSIFAYHANQAINKFLTIQNLFVPSPRCLTNGQFDPLQCNDNMCGCVDRITGSWDSTVRKVFISTLGPNNPKCFDVGRHKIGEYYTNCEKERNSLMSDIFLENLGEVDLLISHIVQCTPDGEYANPIPTS